MKPASARSLFSLLLVSVHSLSMAQLSAPPGKKLVARERLVAMVNYYPSSDTGLWHKGDSTAISWSGENCSEQFYNTFPDMYINHDRSTTETVYWQSQAQYTTVKQYNEQGKCTGSFYGKRNSLSNQWDTLFISRLMYDNSLRLTDSTISYRDTYSSSFRDSIKIQYSYTEHDTVRTKMIRNNGSWENITREISTTDPLGRIIRKTWAYWNKMSHEWQINIKDSFTYTGIRRFTHLQQYIQHNPDTVINSRRNHYIYYSGRPVPEIDSVETWSRTRNKWYTSAIKQRQFSNGRIIKEFNCGRDTTHNKLDTASSLFYAQYKDTSVVECGDMYWDKTSGRFIRYPYVNFLECDTMGMITQIKTCLVHYNDSIEQKGMIKYYYEKFYVTVDDPTPDVTDITLYPNPSANRLQTQLSIPMEGTHEVNIAVYDMLGRQLLTDQFTHQGYYEGSLQSGSWPPGTYLVSVFIDGRLKSTLKLIK